MLALEEKGIDLQIKQLIKENKIVMVDQ